MRKTRRSELQSIPDSPEECSSSSSDARSTSQGFSTPSSPPEELYSASTPSSCSEPNVLKKPSIPNILVLDPVVIVSNSPTDPDASVRRRPSSILKKRDSSSEEPHNTLSCLGNSTSVSGRRQLQEEIKEATVAAASSLTKHKAKRRNSAETSFSSEYGHGILKHSCSSLSVDGGSSTDEFKSILKNPSCRRSSLGSNIHTAHQNRPRFSDDYDYAQPGCKRSILKRKSSTSSSQPDVSSSSRYSSISNYSSRESISEPDPKPILKKKSSSEEISDSDYNSTSVTPPPPRPILKKTSSESIPIVVSTSNQEQPIKGCLKKPCKSFDESTLYCDNNVGSNLECSAEKSIMRKSSPHVCSVKKCEEDNTSEEEEHMEESVITRRGSSSSFSYKRRNTDYPDSSGDSTTSPAVPVSPPGKKGQGISQKIAALQISGESSWKKRVSKPNPEIEITEGEKRNGILANRLSMLETSQESWRKRVGEKDAKDFTVQGKLERAGKSSSSESEVPKKKQSFKNPFKMRGTPPAQQPESPSTSSSQIVTVPVTKNDNETFTRFFAAAPTQSTQIPVIVEDESFNSVILPEDSRQLLATSSTHSHLSIEALAGLASKEDFTSVKLRRAQQEISAQYPYPMLIRVKGKRFVQTRLAAPEMSSINSGDNFILITQTKLYHVIGEYSNRMERSKSLDVVAHIVQKKEFGCHLHTKVVTLQEENVGTASWDSFFETLGCSKTKLRDDVLLGDEADEIYEVSVISRNKVWRVINADNVDERIVPLKEHWGVLPKHSLLQPQEVLIFDFGPEMYVWSGKQAAPDKKKLAYSLAQEMFELEGLGKEFDDVRGGKQSKEIVRRPNWCWLRKVNQFMEPILFIEKFFDWPEDVGRIRIAKRDSINSEPKQFSELVSCSPEMLIQEFTDVSLVLEGFDVKRGRTCVDHLERRSYNITTTNLSKWVISEFSKSEVAAEQIGHFNAGSTYVIRWQYTISFVGKDLKGRDSKHNMHVIGGRDRCAYFFWHGKKSKITEQGASALMTVEMDDLEEKRDDYRGISRGPQIRVEQNYEPPAFLSLFKGNMFIHDSSYTNNMIRLYVVLGDEELEAHFMEVECSVRSFRSNGCFLLFDLERKTLYIWIGSAALPEIKNFALTGGTHALKNGNWCNPITKVVTLKQSHETESFWSVLTGSSHALKWPLQLNQQVTVEMFRFTTINGKFEAIPVISPRRSTLLQEPFPLIQEDLYNASQPSIFLVLSPENTVFVWQGWRRAVKREFVPDDEEPCNLVDSIPLTTIWPKYRVCSVETGLKYAESRGSKQAYYVYAGLEPPEFLSVFPYWDEQTCKEAYDYHVNEGKKMHEKVSLSLLLEELTATRTYTIEELMEKPEGVDLSRLEDYVSDQDFERLFSMPRAQFSGLQAWRKTELKKSVGLF
ncbi:Supervillin [Orchesella cincta]|uniref:Supervillin n=1 Tax=Orchesella cincta TaxID=48709 RepID=A0A1D2NK19_ORCCI|nr:Supervillin [Orchesella cincta]